MKTPTLIARLLLTLLLVLGSSCASKAPAVSMISLNPAQNESINTHQTLVLQEVRAQGLLLSVHLPDDSKSLAWTTLEVMRQQDSLTPVAIQSITVDAAQKQQLEQAPLNLFDTGLQPQAHYTYAIFLRDAQGELIHQSAPAKIEWNTTQFTSPPPPKLDIHTLGERAISLEWDKPQSPWHIMILRRELGKNNSLTRIATIPPSVEAHYTDQDIHPHTSYAYRIAPVLLIHLETQTTPVVVLGTPGAELYIQSK